MTYFVQEREKTELVGTDRWTDGRTDEPKDGNTKKKWYSAVNITKHRILFPSADGRISGFHLNMTFQWIKD